MRCDEKGQKMKSYFGDFLLESRRMMDMSVYDMGYALGISHATVWCWEKGLSFPKSIVLLKKLALVFEEIPALMKNLVVMTGIAPSKSEWTNFEKKVLCEQGTLISGISPIYSSRDRRDTDYKRAFGNYLRRERQKREISFIVMAEAFNVTRQTYCLWEVGSAFPQDVMVLAYLNKLYGNLFDVLFGLCKKEGIHLSFDEKRFVLQRLSEFDNTGRWDSGKSQFSSREKLRRKV